MTEYDAGKNVSKAIDRAKSRGDQESGEAGSENRDTLYDAVASLNSTFTLHYQSLWAINADEDLLSDWLEELDFKGFFAETIISATKMWVDSGERYPPNLQQFIHACHIAEIANNELPDVNVAYIIACGANPDTSPERAHRVVREAVAKIGRNRLRSEISARETFKSAYIGACHSWITSGGRPKDFISPEEVPDEDACEEAPASRSEAIDYVQEMLKKSRENPE